MSVDLSDIFDRKLDEVLGGSSVAEATAGSPRTAAEIGPLLELATACRGAFGAGVPGAAPAAVRENMMSRAQAALADRQTRGRKRHGLRRRFLTRPALIAAGLLALTSGTALAANAAGPDSVLYPLKQGMEDARLALTTNDLSRAAVQAGDAGKRLDEIQGMVDQNKPGYVMDLLARYDSEIADARSLVAQAAAQGKDTTAVANMIAAIAARHDALLSQIINRVPAGVRTQIEHAEGMPAAQPGQNMGQGTGSGAAGGGQPPAGGNPAGGNPQAPPAAGSGMQPPAGSQGSSSGGRQSSGGSQGSMEPSEPAPSSGSGGSADGTENEQPPAPSSGSPAGQSGSGGMQGGQGTGHSSGPASGSSGSASMRR